MRIGDRKICSQDACVQLCQQPADCRDGSDIQVLFVHGGYIEAHGDPVQSTHRMVHCLQPDQQKERHTKSHDVWFYWFPQPIQVFQFFPDLPLIDFCIFNASGWDRVKERSLQCSVPKPRPFCCLIGKHRMTWHVDHVGSLWKLAQIVLDGDVSWLLRLLVSKFLETIQNHQFFLPGCLPDLSWALWVKLQS